MRPQRKRVWDKSGGYCWYCGDPLNAHNWHIDHINPVWRGRDDAGAEDADRLENLATCCPSCNRLKSVWSVEDFRKEIAAKVGRLRQYTPNFRIAERYGLVKEVIRPVVFWFEENIEPTAEEE